jgi:acyl-CoA thioester hydrolase
MGHAVETMRGFAHPWLCDVMGHLNSRHIFALFDDAGFQFIALLGYPFAVEQPRGLGWADVHFEIDLSREVPEGTALLVRTGIAKLGSKSFTCVHQLVTAQTEFEHARMSAVIVRFDLNARRAISLPDDFIDRTRAYML